jgi:hypothetical protein
MFDLDHVNACLHVARDMVLDQATTARGAHKRRLKNVEGAILDALGLVSRNGMTPAEWSAWAKRLRRG